VESALNHVRLLEDEGFGLIKNFHQGFDPLSTIAAYRKISSETDYPLHIGVTEAGPPFSGAIKSAAALGILLYQGLGDTIRISLTGEPVLEVMAAYHLLRALHLRKRGVEIVSCRSAAARKRTWRPSCARWRNGSPRGRIPFT